MDIDALVKEICRRVQEKVDHYEAAADMPKLLVLTQEHGEDCHKTLECPRLAEYYQTDCALMQEYQVQMVDYEAVIAYNLTCEALGKIANGIFDNGYTKLFGEALLSGKKIFVPAEAVELYGYKATAPALYYRKMEAHLQLLLDSGVTIAPMAELESLILTGQTSKAERVAQAVEAVVAEAAPAAGVEYPIYKKVVTEKDVILAHREKADTLVVAEKAIFTDLAKEYARKRNMTILRREISLSKRG